MNDDAVRARARALVEDAGFTAHNVHKVGRSWRINGLIAPNRPFVVGWIVGRQAFLALVEEAVRRWTAEEGT